MRRYLGMLLAAGLATTPASALAQPETKADAKNTNTPAQVDTMNPRLGVTVLTVSAPLRAFFGSTNSTGVLVSEVEPGSPASYAGIAIGDLIQEVGTIQVDEAPDVPDALAKATKGRKVQIKLLRNHLPKTIEVKLDTKTSVLQLGPMEWLRQLMDSDTRSKST
jgi:serine protease Do